MDLGKMIGECNIGKNCASEYFSTAIYKKKREAHGTHRLAEKQFESIITFAQWNDPSFEQF